MLRQETYGVEVFFNCKADIVLKFRFYSNNITWPLDNFHCESPGVTYQ